MDRLEQIKNEVAREYGYNDWEDRGNYIIKFAEHDATWEDVARRYATEMVRHDRERVASEARVIHTGTEKSSWQINDIIVDKQSITSIDIELI